MARTDACGWQNSNAFIVSVSGQVGAPTITKPAAGCAGSDYVFTVPAVGGVSYEWAGGGAASGNSYTYSSATAGALTVTVRAVTLLNEVTCRSAVSAATVTAYALPVISDQPASTSTCSGSTVSLGVTASPATAYQWKKDGNNVTDGSGGTTSNYVTAALTAGATYSVVVANGSCSVTSDDAVVTVNALPTISRSGGAASQSVNQNAAITTITYTASNATSISRGGSLPSGVTGSISTTTLTISGTPSATGTFGYTVSASHTNGCVSATTSTGTITVKAATPPGAASTRTWVIGTQTWSAPLQKAQSGCTAATDLGTTNPPTTAYYRSSGLYSGSGYLYNWKCVSEQAANLCPSPWRVPTKDDFITLDKAFGGSGSNRTADQSWITTNYVTSWGGVYAGLVRGASVANTGEIAVYWSSTASGDNAYCLYFRSTDGFLGPQNNNVTYQRYGSQVRCVKN
jgi:uncharacterized protein (TIGR02145 family)